MGLRTWSRWSAAALLSGACGGNVMHLGDTAADGGAGTRDVGGAVFPTGGTGGSFIGGGSSTGGSSTGGSSTGTGTGGTSAGSTSAGGSSTGAGGDLIARPCDPQDIPRSGSLALTGIQYDRTVRDLLGDVPPAPHRFQFETIESGFRSARVDDLNEVGMREIADAASEVAGRAMLRLDNLWTCGSEGYEDRTCAASFLLTFAERAFRRPLTAAEKARVQLSFESQSVPVRLAVRNVIAMLLSDPTFYVFFGSTSDTLGTAAPLTPYAMASRLSYFLTRTTPDAELLAAAAAGQLATVDQVRAQANRLIGLPAAANAIGDFLTEWLELDRLDEIAKDPSVYPQYASLKEDMKTETRLFGQVALSSGNSWKELFISNVTYINEPLAKLYGVGGVTGATFNRVELERQQRGGLFTQASFLSAYGSSSSSNPVLRGLFIRDQVLCQEMPPPPPNVPPPAPPQLYRTTRERFAAHSANPCASCHRLMDPIGYGFEHYDGVGQYRVLDNGSPVDSSGVVWNVERGDVAFDGAADLVAQLLTMKEVPDCLATQFFRFALQRREAAGDECSLAPISASMRAGAPLRDTMVTIATTDAFRYARP